jgi:class 3 adenylate cyclase
MPPVRYARSGDAQIAFRVMGEGPPDVVFIGGPAAHLDVIFEDPGMVSAHQRVASFARLVNFDRRGTGLSDPLDRPLTLEQQMDDLEAVLKAAGMDRVALIAEVEPGLCAMYAATHPERVSALVLANAAAGGGLALTPERREAFGEVIENHWGEGRFMSFFAPSRAADPAFARWWLRFERACMSPAMARKMLELNTQIDLRGLLPAIRVPTLVLHQRENPLIPIESGRELADLIPGARFVEAGGTDSYCWPAADDPEMDLIEEFITGRAPRRAPRRMLATVLFTDIVDSTDHASRLGDSAWRKLFDRHCAIVREQLEQFRGTEIKTMGDGFLATFDGPARGVVCARELVASASDMGLALRCGLHTGECEQVDGDIGGIAVHIGARVTAQARPREVLVSGTVRDLVVGSELEFEDRGEHRLRGVPGEWRLYALRERGRAPGTVAS